MTKANPIVPACCSLTTTPTRARCTREYLEFSGFDVVEAGNGMEALQRAVDTSPDIILMDLSLPVMDGWEATRRLKADQRTARDSRRRADRPCARRHFRGREEGRLRRVCHQAVPARGSGQEIRKILDGAVVGQKNPQERQTCQEHRLALARARRRADRHGSRPRRVEETRGDSEAGGDDESDQD